MYRIPFILDAVSKSDRLRAFKIHFVKKLNGS